MNVSAHRSDSSRDALLARALRNAPPARLYEDAVRTGDGIITSAGALATLSAEKTGRSPLDKRIVEEPQTKGDVWWGRVNLPLAPTSFDALRRQAIDSLAASPQLYVFDGFAGWDAQARIKVRTICARPYHALFMHCMLIRPSRAELASFGEPDYVIYNAGPALADPTTPGVSSTTNVSLSLGRREVVILGTEYAGEMKKGVFTLMNYLLPKRGVLSMHCSANEGAAGEVCLFFGVSGTGKTTLSTVPERKLLGDDEHGWHDRGVFNIEGGCYAKCIGLSAKSEPEIFRAIRFGTVLENVAVDPDTREVDYEDASITENTRAAYPIEHIEHAKIPCVGGHPQNIIFLTFDAFGVLPPVGRLSPEQAMFHFLCGYSAKVAGTEVGVTEPVASFSPCFGGAFLVWHPMKYAELLAEKMRRHGSRAWLVNTGWSGGSYGVGRRMSLAHTRAIVGAIHSGELAKAPVVEDSRFRLSIPASCPGVPSEILMPARTWPDRAKYDATAARLVAMFEENYGKYAASRAG